MTDRQPTRDDVIEAIARGICVARYGHLRGYEGREAQYHKEAQATLAAQEALGLVLVQGWQPIESAPRDGGHIDVWANGLRYADAYWDGEGFAVLDSTGYGVEVEHPTHWMPLPASPIAGALAGLQSDVGCCTTAPKE
jgi:hypothetical protein